MIISTLLALAVQWKVVLIDPGVEQVRSGFLPFLIEVPANWLEHGHLMKAGPYAFQLFLSPDHSTLEIYVRQDKSATLGSVYGAHAFWQARHPDLYTPIHSRYGNGELIVVPIKKSAPPGSVLYGDLLLGYHVVLRAAYRPKPGTDQDLARRTLARMLSSAKPFKPKRGF